MCDRLLPAFLFGLLAVSAAWKVLALAQQGPADPSSQAQLLYWLALAHRSLGFLFPALLTVLYVIRRSPVGARAGVLPMVIALLGTFGMSLAVSQPVTTVDWRVLALGDLLVAVGLIFTLYAVATLGSCFGLAAEARGLITSGPYRLVRHPVYLGEFVSMFGYLLPVLSPLTLAVFALFCLCQAWRVGLEEWVLAGTFAEYVAYRRRTPALLPWPRP